MRILVLTNLYPNPFEPNRGLFNRNQVRHLAEQHDVTVISPILFTDEWAALRLGHSKLPPGRKRHADGITVVHPRYYYTPKMLRNCYGRFYQASVRRVFNRTVQEFQPELVFAPWAYPDGWAAVRLSHRIGLPVAIKVHGSDIHQLSRFPGRFRGTEAALREADGIVVVSEDLKTRIAELGVDFKKTRVVYNGIDTELFSPGDRQEARAHLGLPPDQRIVITIGSLVPVKGHSVLLQAINSLATCLPALYLHLLGSGPLQKPLQNQAATLGLAERVMFHGSKSHAELVEWYRAADLVVVPSLAEGIPNVLLEAMACGVPCVATCVGGIAEIVPPSFPCKLVDPGDVQALAGAIGTMLETRHDPRDPKLVTRSHRQAAAELSQFFSTLLDRHCPQGGAAVQRHSLNLSLSPS